jgi:hypothetical protein
MYAKSRDLCHPTSLATSYLTMKEALKNNEMMSIHMPLIFVRTLAQVEPEL